MFLDGKIDRVDILDADGKRYVKIIDYKSGAKSFHLQEIYYGLQLQLMLYLGAFLSLSPLEAVLPGGVFYFRVSDPMIASLASLSGEEIERLLLKELKMSGLVLADETVVQGLDEDYQKACAYASAIVPVGTTTAGGFRKDASVASLEEYQALMEFTKRRAAEIGTEIRQGNISVSPYKMKQQTSCDYCEYRAVCQFDSINGGSYRQFPLLEKEELWRRIKQEAGEKEEK